jgi:hypothetical protein
MISKESSDAQGMDQIQDHRSCNTFESNIGEDLTIPNDEDMLLSGGQHWINVNARSEVGRQMIQSTSQKTKPEIREKQGRIS